MKSMDWLQFEHFMGEIMAQCHIVGAAVAIATDSDVLYAKGFGVKDLGTREPVNPDTIFGCASVSKSLTAMAMAQLGDAGYLTVEDPVVRHIPAFSLGGRDASSVQVKHILSHTTGLPPLGRRQDMSSFQAHTDYLSAVKCDLLGEPGEYFSYSNDAFLQNGHIIETASHKLYRRYMTANILDAAGMNRSTYSLEEIPKLGNHITPYIWSEEGQNHMEVPWSALGVYEVGGGLRSSVLDLMSYGQIYLRGGKTPQGTQLVSLDGIRRMWNTPMFRSTKVSDYNLGLVTTRNYGRGLLESDDSFVTLVEHSGSQPGVSSNFGFVPERGITVAVLTNVRGVPAAAIWLAAVNTALGIPIETKKSVEVAIEATPEELVRFQGTYRSDEGGRLEITSRDGGLMVRTEGQEFPAFPSDERTVFFTRQGQQQVIRFYYGRGQEEGRPWAVLFGSRMLRRLHDLME